MQPFILWWKTFNVEFLSYQIFVHLPTLTKRHIKDIERRQKHLSPAERADLFTQKASARYFLQSLGQASTPSLRGPAIGFTQRDRKAIVLVFQRFYNTLNDTKVFCEITFISKKTSNDL